MTRTEVRRLVTTIAGPIKYAIAAAVAPFRPEILELRAWISVLREEDAAMQEQIKVLQEQTKELQAREFQGTWDAERAYAKGAMVQRNGSTWHSNVNDNRTTPGQHANWTLMAKRGADGKDARGAA